ncbi:MAG: DUF2726 domain-containing protein [Clostridiales bacterium]|jgi:hypothetical protein|nr:DUF2726 domain-containing protein [Clostridiales bacterium]
MLPEEVFKTVIIVLAAAVAFTLLIVLAAKLLRRKKPAKFKGATEEWSAPEYAYNLKASPMTAAENRFYFVLREVLPENYVVIPQMPLTAVVERPGQSAAVNKIDRKSVDFGVFRAQKRGKDKILRPVFLIELDDETHSLSYREERDKFVNGVCRQIELPLLRVPAGEYGERAVGKLVGPFVK